MEENFQDQKKESIQQKKRKRQRITRAMVEEGIKMLTSLPPIDKNTIVCTKAEAIKEWAPHIQKAQEQGYSLEQITANLRKLGFEVSPQNLKIYLSKAKRKKTRAKQQDTPRPTSSFTIKEDSEEI